MASIIKGGAVCYGKQVAEEKGMDGKELLSSIRSVIEYHRGCGIESYPVSEKMLEQIGRCSSPPEKLPEKPKRVENDPPIKKAVPEKHNEKVIDDGAIPVLKKQIDICRKCFLHETRAIPTAGKGGSSPKLMVIGDWLTVSRGYVPEPGDLFGRDRDQMLARMISAINLKEDEVFITNVIKCSIPDNVQPNSEHIQACSNWLTSQIEVLSPLVICSMGIIASRLLTGCSLPLSRQRGHFVVYKTPAGREIPLMPTYHPTFLLQNPEMKQEAWADLQEIEKKIDRSSTLVNRAR